MVIGPLVLVLLAGAPIEGCQEQQSVSRRTKEALRIKELDPCPLFVGLLPLEININIH